MSSRNWSSVGAQQLLFHTLILSHTYLWKRLTTSPLVLRLAPYPPTSNRCWKIWYLMRANNYSSKFHRTCSVLLPFTFRLSVKVKTSILWFYFKTFLPSQAYLGGFLFALSCTTRVWKLFFCEIQVK